MVRKRASSFSGLGSAGLIVPDGLIFGPNGNGDGRQDLYVAGSRLGGLKSHAGTSSIKRFDGLSGAFIDTFVGPGNGLDGPNLMAFAETDPVTLAYTGR